MDNLTLIKDSFEMWYNSVVSNNLPVTAVINYSDEQTLSIKAIHTARIDLGVVRRKEGMSYVVTIATLEENYNHGQISEQEEKDILIKKFLSKLYAYKA